MHKHLEHNHASPLTLLSILREEYWLLKGRRTINSILSKCLACKRQSVKPAQPEPAPLPRYRITNTDVFGVTGIDLTGPLFLRGGTKIWIAIFTCATYRAVHLELVESLSTTAFMFALRRFIARKGRPTTIYSDNGTNFVGTANALASLDWNVIVAESSVQKIRWNFNPPAAPWWGGWWERLIGILKGLLRRNLGNSVLRLEELSTLLCECESVMNSRPLTYSSDRANELIPITPAHFLKNICTEETTDLDEVDANHLNTRLRLLNSTRQNLKSRFRKEYLSFLVHQGKRQSPKVIKVGDIVLIGDDSTKRINWPLGRVSEVFVGQDGVVRVAKVKTLKGEYTRPIQNLYMLEINNESPSALKRETTKTPIIPEETKQETRTKSTVLRRSQRKTTTPKRLGY
ncbi:Retrotransposon protein [Nesidiocoris tenuis]|uniref:Retrotransposon protein n=1 Tax=Nesidiocoris tenuis TaxID=355587 RepID=A0ABN7B550_9HEMI|nr:Retrotransposon protein [Nesidiocoris tenuis]